MKKTIKLFAAGTMMTAALLSACKSSDKSTETNTDSNDSSSNITTPSTDEERKALVNQAYEDIDNAKYDEAIEIADTLLKANDDDSEAQYIKDRAQKRKAEDEDAMSRHYKLADGRNAIDDGEYDEAESIANELLQKDPNDDEARSLLREAQQKREKQS